MKVVCFFMSWVYWCEVVCVRWLEKCVGNIFDVCFFVVELEIVLFKVENLVIKVNVVIIGNGIDLIEFYFVDMLVVVDVFRLLFVGVMDYVFNVDVMMWFYWYVWLVVVFVWF